MRNRRVTKIIIAAISACSVAGLISCSSVRNTGWTSLVEGQTFYVQRNMWAYKGKIDYLNYSVGDLIPVNAEVIVDKVYKSTCDFTVNGEKIRSFTLVNNDRYSDLTMSELFYRYFDEKLVDLSQFTEKEQQFINNFRGFYKEGISKEALLVGRGYPPGNRTSSLDEHIWVYWRNRWKSYTIEFEDGVTKYRNGNILEN